MKKRKNSSAKMKEVREKIDKIDSKILPLMIKRSILVNKALALKTKKSEIVDLRRIRQIKRKISSQSKKLGGNPRLISNIWMSIINNFIDFEKKNLNK